MGINHCYPCCLLHLSLSLSCAHTYTRSNASSFSLAVLWAHLHLSTHYTKWMDGCMCVGISFFMLHVCVYPFVFLFVYVCMGCVSLSLCLLIRARDQTHICFRLYLCLMHVCVFLCVCVGVYVQDSQFPSVTVHGPPWLHRIVGKLDVTTIPIYHQTDTNKDTHTNTYTHHLTIVRRTPTVILHSLHP